MLNDDPVVGIDRDNNADGELAFRHFASVIARDVPKRETDG
jgi:hypothetical protein